jgi:hypothetical protein
VAIILGLALLVVVVIRRGRRVATP